MLELRASHVQLVREHQALGEALERSEGLRVTLDAEAAELRSMLADAEARCQAEHTRALEAATGARLCPLHPRWSCPIPAWVTDHSACMCPDPRVQR